MGDFSDYLRRQIRPPQAVEGATSKFFDQIHKAATRPEDPLGSFMERAGLAPGSEYRAEELYRHRKATVGQRFQRKPGAEIEIGAAAEIPEPMPRPPAIPLRKFLTDRKMRLEDYAARGTLAQIRAGKTIPVSPEEVDEEEDYYIVGPESEALPKEEREWVEGVNVRRRRERIYELGNRVLESMYLNKIGDLVGLGKLEGMQSFADNIRDRFTKHPILSSLGLLRGAFAPVELFWGAVISAASDMPEALTMRKGLPVPVAAAVDDFGARLQSIFLGIEDVPPGDQAIKDFLAKKVRLGAALAPLIQRNVGMWETTEDEFGPRHEWNTIPNDQAEDIGNEVGMMLAWFLVPGSVPGLANLATRTDKINKIAKALKLTPEQATALLEETARHKEGFIKRAWGTAKRLWEDEVGGSRTPEEEAEFHLRMTEDDAAAKWLKEQESKAAQEGKPLREKLAEEGKTPESEAVRQAAEETIGPDVSDYDPIREEVKEIFVAEQARMEKKGAEGTIDWDAFQEIRRDPRISLEQAERMKIEVDLEMAFGDDLNQPVLPSTNVRDELVRRYHLDNPNKATTLNQSGQPIINEDYLRSVYALEYLLTHAPEGVQEFLGIQGKTIPHRVRQAGRPVRLPQGVRPENIPEKVTQKQHQMIKEIAYQQGEGYWPSPDDAALVHDLESKGLIGIGFRRSITWGDRYRMFARKMGGWLRSSDRSYQKLQQRVKDGKITELRLLEFTTNVQLARRKMLDRFGELRSGALRRGEDVVWDTRLFMVGDVDVNGTIITPKYAMEQPTSGYHTTLPARKFLLPEGVNYVMPDPEPTMYPQEVQWEMKQRQLWRQRYLGMSTQELIELGPNVVDNAIQRLQSNLAVMEVTRGNVVNRLRGTENDMRLALKAKDRKEYARLREVHRELRALNRFYAAREVQEVRRANAVFQGKLREKEFAKEVYGKELEALDEAIVAINRGSLDEKGKAAAAHFVREAERKIIAQMRKETAPTAEAPLPLDPSNEGTSTLLSVLSPEAVAALSGKGRKPEAIRPLENWRGRRPDIVGRGASLSWNAARFVELGDPTDLWVFLRDPDISLDLRNEIVQHVVSHNNYRTEAIPDGILSWMRDVAQTERGQNNLIRIVHDWVSDADTLKAGLKTTEYPQDLQNLLGWVRGALRVLSEKALEGKPNPYTWIVMPKGKYGASVIEIGAERRVLEKDPIDFIYQQMKDQAETAKRGPLTDAELNDLFLRATTEVQSGAPASEAERLAREELIAREEYVRREASRVRLPGEQLAELAPEVKPPIGVDTPQDVQEKVGRLAELTPDEKAKLHAGLTDQSKAVADKMDSASPEVKVAVRSAVEEQGTNATQAQAIDQMAAEAAARQAAVHADESANQVLDRLLTGLGFKPEEIGAARPAFLATQLVNSSKGERDLVELLLQQRTAAGERDANRLAAQAQQLLDFIQQPGQEHLLVAARIGWGRQEPQWVLDAFQRAMAPPVEVKPYSGWFWEKWFEPGGRVEKWWQSLRDGVLHSFAKRWALKTPQKDFTVTETSFLDNHPRLRNWYRKWVQMNRGADEKMADWSAGMEGRKNKIFDQLEETQEEIYLAKSMKELDVGIGKMETSQNPKWQEIADDMKSSIDRWYKKASETGIYPEQSDYFKVFSDLVPYLHLSPLGKKVMAEDVIPFLMQIDDLKRGKLLWQLVQEAMPMGKTTKDTVRRTERLRTLYDSWQHNLEMETLMALQRRVLGDATKGTIQLRMNEKVRRFIQDHESYFKHFKPDERGAVLDDVVRERNDMFRQEGMNPDIKDLNAREQEAVRMVARATMQGQLKFVAERETELFSGLVASDQRYALPPDTPNGETLASERAWVKVPNEPRNYGRLVNYWIDPNVLLSYRQMMKMKDDVLAMAFEGWGGVRLEKITEGYNKLQGLWKSFRVAYDPSVIVFNDLSNIFFLSRLAGYPIDPLHMGNLKRYVEAWKRIGTRRKPTGQVDPLYLEARDNGVQFHSSLAKEKRADVYEKAGSDIEKVTNLEELRNVQEKWQKEGIGSLTVDDWKKWAQGKGSSIHEKVVVHYASHDGAFRMYLYEMARSQGRAPREAAKVANTGALNYSEVSRTVELVSKLPFVGRPFFRFPVLAAQALMKAAWNRPWDLLPLWFYLKIAPPLVATLWSNLTEEDQEVERSSWEKFQRYSQEQEAARLAKDGVYVTMPNGWQTNVGRMVPNRFLFDFIDRPLDYVRELWQDSTGIVSGDPQAWEKHWLGGGFESTLVKAVMNKEPWLAAEYGEKAGRIWGRPGHPASLDIVWYLMKSNLPLPPSGRFWDEMFGAGGWWDVDDAREAAEIVGSTDNPEEIEGQIDELNEEVERGRIRRGYKPDWMVTAILESALGIKPQPPVSKSPELQEQVQMRYNAKMRALNRRMDEIGFDKSLSESQKEEAREVVRMKMERVNREFKVFFDLSDEGESEDYGFGPTEDTSPRMEIPEEVRQKFMEALGK